MRKTKSHILKALEKTNWKINGTDGAAELLKKNPRLYEQGLKN